MKLVFTPGSEELTINFFSEHKKDKRLSASYSIEVTPETVFPEIPDIDEFDSVQCINSSGVVIPLINGEYYHKVDSIDVNYNEDGSTHMWTMNVVIV